MQQNLVEVMFSAHKLDLSNPWSHVLPVLLLYVRTGTHVHKFMCHIYNKYREGRAARSFLTATPCM